MNQPLSDVRDGCKTAAMFRPHRSRRLWRISGATAILFITLAVAVTCTPPDNSGSSEGTQARAARIDARNNFVSGSSVTAGQNAACRFQRIAVVNQSNHPLMRGALSAVVEQLRQLSIVQHVDYFGPNNRPEAGIALYDFYIVCDMSDFDESGALPAGRVIDATITIQAGDVPWTSNLHVIDQLSPPQVNVNFSGTLDHHSVTTGNESVDDTYRQAATNVAEQLSEALTKNVLEWADKYGVAGDLPEALYPPYQPLPDDLPLPHLDGVERFVSGHGLLVHNLTVWRGTSENWLGVLEDLQQRLTAAGWGVETHRAVSPRLAGWFRAQRGEDVMEGFRVSGTQEIVVKYTDRISRADLDRVIEQLLEDDSNSATLVTLVQIMNPAHRDRLAQRMLNDTSTDLAMQLFIARYLHQQGDDDAALRRLDRAWFICQATGQDRLRDAIKKFAQEITNEDAWQPRPPDEMMLREMRVTSLSWNDAKPEMKVELGLNQSLMVYLPPMVNAKHNLDGNTSDKPYIITVRVERSTIPEGVFSVVLRRGALGDNAYAQMIVTPHHPPSPFQASSFIGHIRNRWTVHATARETTPQRFEVTLQTEPHNQ